jgi:ABC-type transporter Mla MlaB component
LPWLRHMLRITLTEPTAQPATLRLEGQLIGPWVGELRRACREILDGGRSLALDLADVSFLDGEGIELLQTLETQRVAVRNCSPFVAVQLGRRR